MSKPPEALSAATAPKMKGRILVCGDAMADHYWHGSVKRVSPEAPVTVVSIDRTEKRDGAAANVANNIEAMGIPVERIFGRSKERIQKIRILARGQHLQRVDFDYPQEPIECDAVYEDALGRCDFIVFVDYGKGSLSKIPPLIAKARAAGRTVLVDPHGHDFEKYRGAHVLKPNREEMKDLVGGWKNQEELDFKARQFLVSAGIDQLLLTQAEAGMTLYTPYTATHLEAIPGEIVDVSGAGEAALAGYAAAIARGASSNVALDKANKAASLCISRFGTVVLTEAEIFG